MKRNKEGFVSIFNKEYTNFENQENEIVRINWNSDEDVEDPNKSMDVICVRNVVTPKTKNSSNTTKSKSKTKRTISTIPKVNSKPKITNAQSPNKLGITPTKKFCSLFKTYAGESATSPIVNKKPSEDVLIETSYSIKCTPSASQIIEAPPETPEMCATAKMMNNSPRRTPMLTKNVNIMLEINSNSQRASNVQSDCAQNSREPTITPAKKACSIFKYAVEMGNSSTTTEKELEDVIIEWNDSSSSSHASQIIETPMETQQNVAPTELDLLIDLIEQENRQEKDAALKEQNKKQRKYYLKDGYLHKFHQKYSSTRSESRFLEYDKRFGLRSGTVKRVTELENSFGAHIATLAAEEQDKCTETNEKSTIIQCVLYADMAKKVKVDSRLEVFFDPSYEPYKIVKNGEEVQIYVQPHKILLLR